MNQVVLIGNLTRDPEYRETGNGVCKFSVAVTDGYGEKEYTSYIPVVVFGKSGQNCSKYLVKGSKVGIQGRIQTGSYEKEGRKIYTTDVIANNVEFLTPRGEKSESPQEDSGFTKMTDDEIPW